MSNGKQWIIYTRVSTDEQAREGISLDAQLTKCQAILAAYDVTDPLVITDAGKSAKNLKRPGIKQLLDLVRADEVAGVVITKLDRLTRSLKDLLEIVELFKAHNVAFRSVQDSIDTSGPMGTFMISMLGALAQLEREQIGERVKTARDHLATNGYWPGGVVPAGCQLREQDGHKVLERNPTTAPIIEHIWPMVIGGSTLGDLVRYLTENNIPNARGNVTWSKASARNLIRSKTVTGYLVDQETQDKAIETLAGRFNPKAAKPANRDQQGPAWPLKGIATCSQCGSKLVAVTGGRGGKRYLRCTGRIRKGTDFCDAKDLPAEAYEDAIAEALNQELANRDHIRQAIIDRVAEHAANYSQAGDQVDQLRQDLNKWKTQQGRLLDRYADEADNAAAKAITTRISELQTKIDATELELETAESLAKTAAIMTHMAETVTTSLIATLDTWQHATDDDKRDLFASCLESCAIHDDHIDLTTSIKVGTKENDLPPEKSKRSYSSKHRTPVFTVYEQRLLIPSLYYVDTSANKRWIVNPPKVDIEAWRALPAKVLVERLLVSKDVAKNIKQGRIDDGRIYALVHQSTTDQT